MADITITVANVILVSGNPTKYLAGVTITAGETLYLDSGTNTAKLAHAITSAATAVCIGISLHAALTGQPILVAGSGCVVSFGAILTVGAPYLLSGNNAGGIAPIADLAATWITGILGIATTTSQMPLNFLMPGVAHS